MKDREINMALNSVLVSLFNDIMHIEEKAIITKEYEDISNNDMHIIDAIGIAPAPTIFTGREKRYICLQSAILPVV